MPYTAHIGENDDKEWWSNSDNEWKKATQVITAMFAAAIAFIFVIYQKHRLMQYPTGAQIEKPRLDELAKYIKDGAKSFLQEEYKWLSVFVACLSIVLLILFSVEHQIDDTQGVRTFVSFLIGAALSATAGYLGMMVATDGNVRTTVACCADGAGALNAGLQVAFTTGSIMGFTVVGLGLMGLSLTYLIVGIDYGMKEMVQVLSGFGFGASSIALFARVAGGIYTKAADVGADLVGKVEKDIDEDDPHNPAVIADNVGDNVGDVAGMGADLFESYVGSIIAAAALAPNEEKIALPFYLSAVGIVCSIIGCFFVSTKEKGDGWNSNLTALMMALEKGMYVAGALFVACSAGLCAWMGGSKVHMWESYACVCIGLVAGMLIGKITEIFTSFDYEPVQSITARGKTGPATVVIQGLGVGMLSCVPPTLILVAAILSCAAIEGEYGVAIAAVGMLSTLGITLATDAYGPVADNAGGLAEMDPSVDESVRAKTDALDALGNTTAATGKGFAIGSAVLTSLSLLAAFKNSAGLLSQDLDIGDPVVLSGVLFGAMLPFMFAALTMISVGKAAAEIIVEVRRQFEENPGLKECIRKAMAGEEIKPEDDVLPDSERCVAISTKSSVREMIAPGCYAILSPLIVGFLIGPRCLMGMLSGAIASGCMVGIMMSNAGGAWDNSKKLCEKLGIKKTDQGKACIVGDTVGDPFKDTSGPALNILIKLMSMVSLTIAPLIARHDDWEDFGYGFLPLGLFFVVTIALMMKGILSWNDGGIGEMIDGDAAAKPAAKQYETVSSSEPATATATATAEPSDPVSSKEIELSEPTNVAAHL